jgi:hypothetical protein
VTHAGESVQCGDDKEKEVGGDDEGKKKQNRKVTEMNMDSRHHFNLLSESNCS